MLHYIELVTLLSIVVKYLYTTPHVDRVHEAR